MGFPVPEASKTQRVKLTEHSAVQIHSVRGSCVQLADVNVKGSCFSGRLRNHTVARMCCREDLWSYGQRIKAFPSGEGGTLGSTAPATTYKHSYLERAIRSRNYGGPEETHPTSRREPHVWYHLYRVRMPFIRVCEGLRLDFARTGSRSRGSFNAYSGILAP